MECFPAKCDLTKTAVLISQTGGSCATTTLRGVKALPGHQKIRSFHVTGGMTGITQDSSCSVIYDQAVLRALYGDLIMQLCIVPRHGGAGQGHSANSCDQLVTQDQRANFLQRTIEQRAKPRVEIRVGSLDQRSGPGRLLLFSLSNAIELGTTLQKPHLSWASKWSGPARAIVRAR